MIYKSSLSSCLPIVHVQVLDCVLGFRFKANSSFYHSYINHSALLQACCSYSLALHIELLSVAILQLYSELYFQLELIMSSFLIQNGQTFSSSGFSKELTIFSFIVLIQGFNFRYGLLVNHFLNSLLQKYIKMTPELNVFKHAVNLQFTQNRL